MAISPADMVLFSEVVRAGSFTAAARTYGITKQAVSERISRLEEKLGVRLLERTTRRLRVTGPGVAYSERCAAIAAQIAEANNEVRQQQAEPIGLLRVASPMLFGRRYLAGAINAFLLKYPGARVELVLADRRLDLIEEGLDVAIHIGPLEDSTLVARKLGTAETCYVASPRFLRTHGTPRPQALSTARCIGLGPFETWIVGGTRVRIEPVLIANDHEVGLAAALAGVGIARLPRPLCDAALRSRKLKLLFGSKPAAVRPIHAVYPSRAHLPAKVRLFLELLTQQLADAP